MRKKHSKKQKRNCGMNSIGGRQMTKHHIICKCKGGRDYPSNIAYITREVHTYYHQLFFTLLPDQIVTYLVNHFWNGQWNWVRKALNEYDKEVLRREKKGESTHNEGESTHQPE